MESHNDHDRAADSSGSLPSSESATSRPEPRPAVLENVSPRSDSTGGPGALAATADDAAAQPQPAVAQNETAPPDTDSAAAETPATSNEATPTAAVRSASQSAPSAAPDEPTEDAAGEDEPAEQATGQDTPTQDAAGQDTPTEQGAGRGDSTRQASGESEPASGAAAAEVAPLDDQPVLPAADSEPAEPVADGSEPAQPDAGTARDIDGSPEAEQASAASPVAHKSQDAEREQPAGEHDDLDAVAEDPDNEIDSDSEIGSDSEIDSDGEADSDSEIDSDSEADSDSEIDSDSEADSDSEIDSDSEADSANEIDGAGDPVVLYNEFEVRTGISEFAGEELPEEDVEEDVPSSAGGLTALMLGLAAGALFVVQIGVLSIAAVVVGVMHLRRGAPGRGMAIAGIVLGAVAFLPSVMVGVQLLNAYA